MHEMNVLFHKSGSEKIMYRGGRYYY
ncbi:Protein of unknown function [Bacillus toyonensis]|nr:Protein of unknown function [Bacillus toyonensis]